MRKTSILLILLCVINILPIQAGEALNNKKFAELTDGQRHWYFIGVFSAISHMIGRESQKQSKCVMNWFFDDIEKRKGTLLKNIKLYPEHSPTTIIMASLRRACAVFPKK